MAHYKRNQLEQALARLLEESTKPSLELRTRVKRLLDTDRRPPYTKSSSDPKAAEYAFFSDDSPGKGFEVWLSDYEAFALLTGVRLLQHGWPQGSVVELLRRVRPHLERQHSQILKHDPADLFDKHRILQMATPGSIAVDNTDPVFLTIVSGDNVDADLSPGICRGMKEVSEFVRKHSARAWTLLELASSAYEFRDYLAKAKPTNRGRT